jgi:nucleoid-associated protein YgaU
VAAVRASVAPARATAVVPRAADGGSYVVRPGDTLSAIAARCGTTWPILWRRNRDRIADPNLIYPGQIIHIRALAVARGERR